MNNGNARTGYRIGVRLRGYRADLIARGGRSTTLDFEPEFVAALKKLSQPTTS